MFIYLLAYARTDCENAMAFLQHLDDSLNSLCCSVFPNQCRYLESNFGQVTGILGNAIAKNTVTLDSTILGSLNALLNLKKLDLSNNNLAGDISGLLIPSLETLMIQNNVLTGKPPPVNQIKNYFANSNQFEIIPDGLFTNLRNTCYISK
eukprot:NODE_740_length_4324_cov_0.793609.p3 type:complete len:150 gc:universal NODE_740_length_4324_cov_0.793609:2394-1945(-)